MGLLVQGNKKDKSKYWVLLWGRISRNPYVGETAKGVPKAQFGMAYDKGEFMNIRAVGKSDETRLSCAMEKGDVVAILGEWSQSKYKTKDGEEKIWSETRADIIFSQSLHASLLDLISLIRLIPFAKQIVSFFSKFSESNSAERSKDSCEENAPDSEDEGVLPWERQEEEPESDYVPRI